MISLLNFTSLMIFKHLKSLILTLIIFASLIFLITSIFLISESIKLELNLTLSEQPDIVIKRVEAGRYVDTPLYWRDEISKILGLKDVTSRYYGYYNFESEGVYFTLIGVELFGDSYSKKLTKITKEIDIKEFFQEDSMLIGSSVREFLTKHYYIDYFNFITSDGNFKKVKIAGELSEYSSIFNSDVILLPNYLFQDIFGLDRDYCSDIVANVPNYLELPTIAREIRAVFPESKVISKEDIAENYQRIFDYKSGLFLSIATLSLFAFLILLFQRVSSLNLSQRREIGILRAIGWGISDILKWKVLESSLLSLVAFLFGVLVAYIFVYILDAPILKYIFFGSSNLPVKFELIPIFDLTMLFNLLLFTTTPYIASNLIPTWRMAVVDAYEVMR